MSMLSRGDTLGLSVTHVSKKVLTADETELYELSKLAGIEFDQDVFKIIVDLLRLNVAPTAIERMLKSMLNQNRTLSFESASHSRSSRSSQSSGKRS